MLQQDFVKDTAPHYVGRPAQQPARAKRARHLTILNSGCGDVTIAWTPERDASIEERVAAMMAQGWDFWVPEPSMGGLAPPTRAPLREASAARLRRALVMSDDTWDAFLSGAAPNAAGAAEDGLPGTVEIVSTPLDPAGDTSKTKPVRKAKTARDVVEADASLATPRRKGG